MTILFVNDYHSGSKDAFFDADMTKPAGTVVMGSLLTYEGYVPNLESWSEGPKDKLMISLGNWK